MTNARFKFSANIGKYSGECNHVTITLKPGQSLSWGYGGPNEEGYSYCGYTWELDGGNLRMAMTSDASDCDGRLTQYRDYSARLEDLSRSGGFPQWREVDASQRDYAAEAAGY